MSPAEARAGYVGDAITEFSRTFADTFGGMIERVTQALREFAGALGLTPEVLERQRRWNALDPQARRALTIVHDAVDDAEGIYQDAVTDLRYDLLGSLGQYTMRLRMWAASGYGVTEQQAMAEAAAQFRLRHVLGLTRDQAASVAVAILDGYASRPVQKNGA